MNLTDEIREHEGKPTALVAIEGFTLLIITLVAMAANITAITIILRVRSLRKNPHNLLILNLSVADLGVVLTSMTFSLVSVFDGGYLLLRYHKLCLAHAFFAMIFSYVNFPTIVCIAVDRVLIVTNTFPLSHTRVYVMITCCWIIAFTNVMFPTNNLYLAAFVYLPDTLHCSPVWPNRIFRIIYAIINYGMVIAILTTCYAIITYHLRKKGKQLRSHQHSAQTRTLNTSMSSCQSPPSTEMKGIGQLTSLSSSVNQQPSYMAEGPHRQAAETSTIKDPQYLKPCELSSKAAKDSDFQGESEFDATEALSTEETLTSKDKCLETMKLHLAFANASKKCGMYVVSKPTTSSQAKSSLSSPMHEEKMQDKKKEKEEELDEEEEEEKGEEGEEEVNNHRRKYACAEEQIHKNGKPLSKKKIDHVGGESDLGEKEFYSESHGYESEKELGRGEKKAMRANKKFKAEKRVAIMGALLVLTTMLCWTPYVLHHSKYLGLPEGHWFGVFTMWLGYCNALLDPLIYSFLNFRVRREIERFFRSTLAVCNPRKLFRRV